MAEFHKIREEVKEELKKIVDPQKRASLSKSYEQIVSNQREYLSQLIRTENQGDYCWPGEIVEIVPPGEIVVAPAGFWPRGQNPRRHHRTPRVYIYKGLKNIWQCARRSRLEETRRARWSRLILRQTHKVFWVILAAHEVVFCSVSSPYCE